MEAIIFMGLQGAGKTTLFGRRFAQTHVRISLDVLKTRARESALLQSCIASGQSFVVDNTNPTVEQRQRYIVPAKAAGYRIVGYYFEPDIQACLRRNAARPEGERIPVPGLFGTRKKMQIPSFTEGFDALFRVEIDVAGQFVTHEWSSIQADEAPQPERQGA